MSRSRNSKAHIAVKTVMPRSTLYPDSLHCSNSAALPVIDGKFDLPISISSMINPTNPFKVSPHDPSAASDLNFKPKRGAWIRYNMSEHVLIKSKPSRKAGLIAEANDNLDGEQNFSCQMAPLNKARPALKPPVEAWKKNQKNSGEANKLLVTVNVIGSPGPLRFLVYSEDTVERVIQLVLKAYAREGRVPVLGLNYKTVEFCCANNDFEALGLNQSVGSLGTRNFLLYKKKQEGGNPQERRRILISLPVKFWNNMMSAFICYS